MTVKEWIDAVIRGERVNVGLVLVGPRGSGKTVAIELLKCIVPGYGVATFKTSYATRDVARSASENDIIVFDGMISMHDVEVAKAYVAEKQVEVVQIGKTNEIRDIKANVIGTAEFFPVNLMGEDGRRFITVTPIAFIAQLIPYLAR